jgi:NADH:ubiquinone oxidoreductase subunit 6 (subunit J)
MLALATPLINWSALGKIVAVAFIGSVGVVLVFGVLLIGVKHANGAKGSGQRAGFYGLSAICGAICIGAVVIGIYAVGHKPASKKPASSSNSKSAAIFTPAASSTKLIASAR